MFATAFLHSCYPNFWENVAAFATCGKKASLDPDIAQILMQMLNNSAFSQDKPLLKELVDFADIFNQPTGIILISPNTCCRNCGGKLVVRKDRYSKLVLYSESMGTVLARHYYKYWQKGCSFCQHYGYYSVADQKYHYDTNWSELPYFVSSQETAFELEKFDVELLISTSRKLISTTYIMAMSKLPSNTMQEVKKQNQHLKVV